jgi:uncharacterized protein
MAYNTGRLQVWKWLAIMVLTGILGVMAASAQSGYPPRQSDYVNDFAGILPSESEASIQAMLADLEQNSGIEMTVVTIESINDYSTQDFTIESFATNLFNRWRLGNATTNKGIMLLVGVDDRKVRIELGRGYDSTYNKKAQDVINEFILPAFRDKDYVRGIDRGVKGTIHAVTGSWPPGGEPSILDDPNLPRTLGIGGLAGLGVLGFGAYWYFRHKCPGCGKMSLAISSDVLSYPTYSSEGEKEIHRYCGNCGFDEKYVVSIPIRTHSSSSGGGGSSSSSSSSSSSDSGGSSSGGGASGSW